MGGCRRAIRFLLSALSSQVLALSPQLSGFSSRARICFRFPRWSGLEGVEFRLLCHPEGAQRPKDPPRRFIQPCRRPSQDSGRRSLASLDLERTDCRGRSPSGLCALRFAQCAAQYAAYHLHLIAYRSCAPCSRASLHPCIPYQVCDPRAPYLPEI
jgi:hypothetical protein